MVSDEHLWQIIQNGGVEFQSALRFAVVSDNNEDVVKLEVAGFQSALRFAVVSDQSSDRVLGWYCGFNPL